MSEKKTIQFNPELLKFSNNKTRKNRSENGKSDGIRLKKPRKKDETFKKNSILKMIRKHQQEKYNKMLESFDSPKSSASAASVSASFKSDFEDSKQFMDKLLEDNSLKKNVHNSTLRDRNNHSTNSSLLYNVPLENLIEAPKTFVADNTPMNIISPQLNQPKFGCLKNGSLPTYRKWVNATQKNGGSIQSRPADEIVAPIERNESLLSASEMKQRFEKLTARQNIKKKKSKQKRIIRRTFKIGKSKVIPRVSVLISNRTIRSKVSTEGQLLKQKPIEEIKKYLIKRGLIRVGTTAPNDVLKKMYECSVMMCGEIQNHNPDNLLYNFLNSDSI
jgi:hypothetical protein